ncbi:MAG: hypothetical protein KBH21_00485 [Acetoanaerobium sp.]|nr:hypothetical protein [Acetoanaerobium sp.]
MILKYQDGGVITPPNPQPYRIPLKGLDREAFTYNVQSSPLDTSGMVQVLQFNENADLKREQMAVQLEQEKLKKEIAQNKLDFQKQKMAFDLLTKLNGLSNKSGKGVKTPDGIDFDDDIFNRPYFKTKHKETLDQVGELDKELDKLSLELNPSNFPKMLQIIKNKEALLKTLPTDVEVGVEQANLQYTKKLLTGDVPKGYKVNSLLFQTYIDGQNEALNTPYMQDGFGNVSGYNVGSLTNAPIGMLFKPEDEKAKLDLLITNSLKSYSADKVDIQSVGKVGNALVKTTTTSMALDEPTAINLITDAIIADPTLGSYISDQYGSIYGEGLSPNRDIVRGIVKSRVYPLYKADRAVADNKITQTSQMGATDPYRKETHVQTDINVNRQSTSNSTVTHLKSAKDIETNTTEASKKGKVVINNFHKSNKTTEEEKSKFRAIKEELEKIGENINFVGEEAIRILQDPANKNKTAKELAQLISKEINIKRDKIVSNASPKGGGNGNVNRKSSDEVLIEPFKDDSGGKNTVINRVNNKYNNLEASDKSGLVRLLKAIRESVESDTGFPISSYASLIEPYIGDKKLGDETYRKEAAEKIIKQAGFKVKKGYIRRGYEFFMGDESPKTDPTSNSQSSNTRKVKQKGGSPAKDAGENGVKGASGTIWN